jgi:hypothetical protein
MARILLRLSALNLIALVTVFVVGMLSWLRGGRTDPASYLYSLHFFLGLFTIILLNLGVHSLVFIYFLGTGRWVKEVALAYQIPDEPWPKLTRELKRWTYPVSLAAMLVPIAAAVAGAGVQMAGWPWYVHFIFGVATLLVNVWAFTVEYRNVCINSALIDRVMAEVDRIRAAHGLSTNAEAILEAEREASGERGVPTPR